MLERKHPLRGASGPGAEAGRGVAGADPRTLRHRPSRRRRVAHRPPLRLRSQWCFPAEPWPVSSAAARARTGGRLRARRRRTVSPAQPLASASCPRCAHGLPCSSGRGAGGPSGEAGGRGRGGAGRGGRGAQRGAHGDSGLPGGPEGPRERWACVPEGPSPCVPLGLCETEGRDSRCVPGAPTPDSPAREGAGAGAYLKCHFRTLPVVLPVFHRYPRSATRRLHFQ